MPEYGHSLYERLHCDDMAGAASQLVHLQDSFNRGIPISVIGGGETTVVVQGAGLGGRNQEMVLAFAIEASDMLKMSRCQFSFRLPLKYISG